MADARPADARQIALPIPHRTAMGRDDFLVAGSNEDAVAWIDLWPDWPAPTLIIYGAPASGKSHLAAVWGEKANAACISLKGLNDATVREIAKAAKHIIIEDADDLIGDIESEKGLFHLYNLFREEGRSILLTLTEPPIRKSFALPDLASRLRAAPAVSIREPGEELLGAVLVKLFSDRQLKVSQDVIAYLSTHMERSFEAARSLVEAADARALSEKRAVTVPLVREILGG